MAIAVAGTSSPDVEVGVPTSEDADVSMSGACSDVETISAALDDDESSPVSSVPISSSVDDEELVGVDERIAHVIASEELSCVSSDREREGKVTKESEREEDEERRTDGDEEAKAEGNTKDEDDDEDKLGIRDDMEFEVDKGALLLSTAVDSPASGSVELWDVPESAWLENGRAP